jgi:hypothetical protein
LTRYKSFNFALTSFIFNSTTSLGTAEGRRAFSSCFEPEHPIGKEREVETAEKDGMKREGV